MRILLAMRVARKIFLVFSILFVLLLTVAFGYYLSVTHGVSLHPEKLLFSEKSVQIFDQNGEVIQNTNNAILKESISIKELPQSLKDAFVCTEDKRFYKHKGYDFKRILRASANNLKAHTFKEGASTISQQLIKNITENNDRTPIRKIQEIWMAYRLERKLSKDQILELYVKNMHMSKLLYKKLVSNV